MAAVAEAQVRLTLVDRLTARLRGIQERIASLTRPFQRIGQTFSNFAHVNGVQRLTASIGNLSARLHTAASHAALLAGTVGGLGSLALGVGVGQFVGVNAEFEKFGTVLETILGSSDKAKDSLAWISDFAAKTPYDLAGVTDAFVKLQSYGIQPMKGSLLSAGNASAAMGKPLMQAVEAIADAMTGENERLKEFGITTSKEGGKIRYNWVENGKQMTAFAKANSRKQIEAVITGIWNRQYSGAMDKLSTTWEGMVSNLGDVWARFMLAIGEAGAFDALKGVLKDVLAWVNRMTDTGKLTSWAKDISSVLTSITGELRDFLFGTETIGDSLASIQRTPGFLEELPKHIQSARDSVVSIIERFREFASVMAPVVSLVGGPLNAALIVLGGVTFGPLIASIVALVPAVYSLSAALLTTPIGWIIMGVAAIGASVHVLIQRWDEFLAYWSGLWGRITSAFEASWTGGVIAVLTEFNPLTHVMRGMNAVIEYFTGIDLLAEGDRIIGSLLQGVNTKFLELDAWVAGKEAEFIAFFSDIDLAQIGVQIVNSLLAGLQSAWDSVTSWLKEQIAGLTSIMPDFIAKRLGLDVSVNAPQPSGKTPSLPDPTAGMVPLGGGRGIAPPQIGTPDPTAGMVPLGASSPTIVQFMPASPDQMATQTVQAQSVDAGQFNAPEPLLVHQPQTVNAPLNTGGIVVNVQGMDQAAVVAAIERALAGEAARHRANVQSALSDH